MRAQLEQQNSSTAVVAWPGNADVMGPDAAAELAPKRCPQWALFGREDLSSINRNSTCLIRAELHAPIERVRSCESEVKRKMSR
jgi:hypothetical protein